MSFYGSDSGDAANSRLSSADMYAQVPTGDYGPAGSPGMSTGEDGSPRFGHASPYDRRYSDNNTSGQASTMNLSIDDGESQRDLYQRGGAGVGPGSYQRTGSNLQYDHGPEGSEEVLATTPTRANNRQGELSRRNSAMAAADYRNSSSKSGRSPPGFWARLSPRARRFVIIGGGLALALIAVAVAVPVAITSGSKKNNSASDGGGVGVVGGTTTTSAPRGVPTGVNGADWKNAAVGGDGSLVYMENGESFVYNNSFGGFWNAIPFNNSAQAQEDTPPLSETWNYDTHRIWGVNIGGWLTIEPFIVPSLFEPFNSATNGPNVTNGAVDEWHLCQALGANMSAVITEHYETFITEKDFAEIAAAGLNWVRIPIPYWIIEVYPGEPFLANVGWTYFLKAIEWARKYGLRINLDLHAVPGSQNGYNHSSKLGTINFLNGVMGVANAQRTLNYIRTLVEFISQPEYKDVIPMFSVLNEPYALTIGVDVLRHFYIESYNMIREITGFGEGNGPFITFHDGFVAQAVDVAQGGWDGFLPGMDRVAIDQHAYLCFSTPNNDSVGYDSAKPCQYWASKFNTSTQQFGLSMGGEWSLAINDCGLWLNNVGNGARYDGTYYVPGNVTAPAFAAVGTCDQWNDWESWTDATKEGLQAVVRGHMDALRHSFFWTWKTGYSNIMGKIANPMWNYQLGLAQGYVPKDPRLSVGSCEVLVQQQGASMSNNPAPSLSAWMTGGSGAGTLLPSASAQLSSFSAWPPASLGITPVVNLPTYTATAASISTLSAATPTSYPAGYSSVTGVGNGWEDASDTSPWYTSVAGCTYPDPWSGVEAPIPTAPCTGVAAKMKMRRATALIPTPTPTPAFRKV
ncbi:glucan 1,3-beta-glucosidase, partial [Phenoliferia sp. Uapishka_3]